MEITSGQPAIQLGGGYGNNCDGFGGAGFGMMFLAFLAIAAMGGGGFGFGGRGNNIPDNIATTDTVNQAMNYSNLQQQNSQIMAEVQRAQNANMMFAADKYMELQRDIAGNGTAIQNVLQQLMECCCTLQRQNDAQTLDFTKQMYEDRIRTDGQFCELKTQMNAQFCALNERLSADENRRLREKVENLQDDIRFMRLAMGNNFNRDSGSCSSGWISGF